MHAQPSHRELRQIRRVTDVYIQKKQRSQEQIWLIQSRRSTLISSPQNYQPLVQVPTLSSSIHYDPRVTLILGTTNPMMEQITEKLKRLQIYAETTPMIMRQQGIQYFEGPYGLAVSIQQSNHLMNNALDEAVHDQNLIENQKYTFCRVSGNTHTMSLHIQEQTIALLCTITNGSVFLSQTMSTSQTLDA